MELTIFGRFHAREGQGQDVAAALAEVVPLSRAEPGCLSIEAYRSIRDPRLFHIHSRWANETAFEVHAAQAHTIRFLETVQPLLTHALDVTRAYPLEPRA